jgi:predicted alpha/beta-fold hydrolase
MCKRKAIIFEPLFGPGVHAMGPRHHDTLNDLKLHDFRPHHALRHPHLQTIAPLWLPQEDTLRDPRFHRLDLADGDAIIVVDNKPEGWQPSDRVVIMTHGLTGSFESNYMARIGGRLASLGYRIVRVNQRGCGPGFGLAYRPAHSGRSEDLRETIRWAAQQFPGSKITAIGFSLGANVALKMAGEDGQNPTETLDSVIAVSPPLDLAKSSAKMAAGINKVFDKYFTRQILQHIERTAEIFPIVKERSLPKKLSVRMIDDCFTAPMSGFRDAADYYAQSSSLELLGAIKVPTLIMCAADDPVVDTSAYAHLPTNRWLEVLLTGKGGHVGFIARPQPSWGIRWMDEAIVRWLKKRTEGTGTVP